MNWNNYKNWLENNVVDKNKTDNKYTLTSQSAGKYFNPQVANAEINIALNDLLASLQATIEDDDSVYHLLPNYHSNKDWATLVTFDTIQLGKNSMLQDSLSPEVYAILGKMFDEWQQNHEESEEEEEEAINDQQQSELENKLNDQLNKTPIDKEVEELMGYSFLRNLSSQTRAKYLTKWETWLSNYNKLSQERQASWAEEKKQVDKLVELLKDSALEKETTENNNWLTNLPWGKIGWVGGGLLIIIFALGLIKSKIK